MGRVQEDLFIRISTGFDAAGTNQTLQALDNISQKLNAVAGVLAEKVVFAWADFEEELFNVKKTADLTNIELDKMASEFFKISNATGTSVEDLGKIAAALGQLGVEKKDIIDVTKQIDFMTKAFDMGADEAATAAAKIANAFRLEITEKNIIRLGDTVNSLADKTGASTREMIGFLKQFGANATAYGMTLETASALGNVMIEAGKDASTSATQLNRLFGNLVKNQKKAADLLKISQDEFKNILSTDITGAFRMVIGALEKIENRADRNTTAVKIFGQIGQKAANNFIGNLGKLDDALEIARKKQKSMREEAELLLKTLNAQFKRIGSILSNIGKIIGKAIGKDIGDPLKQFNDFLADIVNKLEKSPELARKLGMITLAIIGLAGVLATVVGVGGPLVVMAAQLKILMGVGGAAASAGGGGAAVAGGTGLLGLISGLGGVAFALKAVAGIGATAFLGWNFGSFLSEFGIVKDSFDYILDKLGLTDFSEFEGELGTRKGGIANTPRQPKPPAKKAAGRMEDKEITLSFEKTGDEFIDFILNNLVAKARGRKTCDCSCS